ncbi:MAG: hypothetical protein V4631_19770 [Pseudomonadota bacterium]
MLKHIYDKTDKGREEIATRKYHVPAKLRSLLVMIDGHRPLETLMKNFGPLGLTPDHVSELLEAEYIALIDDGEPEPSAEPAAAVHKVGMTARERMLARREASARLHHEHEEEMAHDTSGPATIAAQQSAAERHQALQEFYTQTIKSTLGLRGMMLQLKVDKCAGIDDFRELRDVYLEAVLKAKGREMALSLSGRLDQLLGIESDVHSS